MFPGMAGVAQYDVGGGYHKRIVISDVKNSEFQELTGFPLHTLEGLSHPAGDFFPHILYCPGWGAVFNGLISCLLHTKMEVVSSSF